MRWLDSQCSALYASSRSTICRPRRPARSSAVFASGSMALAGSFAGTLSRAAAAASSFLRAALIFFCAAGISLVFLSAGAMAGSASSTARSRSAAASALSASRTAAFACLRAGLSAILVFVSMLAK